MTHDLKIILGAAVLTAGLASPALAYDPGLANVMGTGAPNGACSPPGQQYIDSSSAVVWNCGGTNTWVRASQALQGFINNGLVAAYMLTEGSGTTLNDSSGNGNTATITGTTPPLWTADGALSFTIASTTPVPLPAAIQNIQTVEIAVANINQLSTAGASWLVPTDYSGAEPALTIELMANWSGTGYTLGTMGNATRYLAYRNEKSNNSGYSVQASLDNGVHIITAVLNSTTGAVAMYLDGTLAPAADQTPVAVTGLPTGGYWNLGKGEPGNVTCNPSLCSFGGKIYGARYSTGMLTAAQVAQDYQAWQASLQGKGVNLNQSRSMGFTNNAQLVSDTESVGWGHGLPTPATQNPIYLAATNLTTALGYTVTPVVDGGDSKGALVMAYECQSKFTAQRAANGTNIAVMFDNLNNVSGKYGVLANVPPFPSATTQQAVALASAGAIASCVQYLKSQGWWVIVGTGLSRYPASNAGSDTNIKDIGNPIYRQHLAGLVDALWDPATDPRLGADGAAQAGTTATTCSGGATYQSDFLHPTVCMAAVLGFQLANVVEAMFNKRQPPTHASASTTYTMAGTDVYATLRITGTAAAITLPQCGGLEQGAWVQVSNRGSGTDTLSPATEYNAGVTDNIDGAATALNIPAGSVAKYQVQFLGDVSGTCQWTVTQ